MRVIIIEDEKPAARRLKRMLEELNIQVEVMLHSVEESINWFLQNKHPDLIMLDIQLSDGLSFEIFETVSVQSKIIFTTAYDEHALKAFKFNSIDYLLKPIDEDELKAAIEKFKNYNTPDHNFLAEITELKNLMFSPQKEFKKRFTIKVGQHLKIINVNNIECFYSENKATFLHTEKGKNYLIDETLELLENLLDNKKYFRVNRKFIINVNFIKDIVSYTNSRLQIKLLRFDELNIIVSREKVKEFKNWLK